MSHKFKRLTLIQQNDTHAQFEAHPELFWHNGEATMRADLTHAKFVAV
jgi:hypothetical protein